MCVTLFRANLTLKFYIINQNQADDYVKFSYKNQFFSDIIK